MPKAQDQCPKKKKSGAFTPARSNAQKWRRGVAKVTRRIAECDGDENQILALRKTLISEGILRAKKRWGPKLDNGYLSDKGHLHVKKVLPRFSLEGAVTEVKGYVKERKRHAEKVDQSKKQVTMYRLKKLNPDSPNIYGTRENPMPVLNTLITHAASLFPGMEIKPSLLVTQPGLTEWEDCVIHRDFTNTNIPTMGIPKAMEPKFLDIP